MNRRKFVAAVASLLCAPVDTSAQSSTTIRRIGWVDYSSSAENLGVFVQALAARGWHEGKNFKIEYRGGEGKVERLAAVSAELARLPVDLIVAPGTSEALAARKATNSIPIVMTGVDDPVERGLVASLARPGGNVTGLASTGEELSGKLLSLLRELFPRASGMAALLDSGIPEHRAIRTDLEGGARKTGVPLDLVQVQRHTEVEPAIAAIRKRGIQVIVVPFSVMLVPAWVADLALKNGLALASTSPAYVYEGGLMAYANDWEAVFDRAANIVDRVLKGAKPADLPVELPTKFKLIMNAKTAGALRVTIPTSILLRADHVIQ